MLKLTFVTLILGASGLMDKPVGGELQMNATTGDGVELLAEESRVECHPEDFACKSRQSRNRKTTRKPTKKPTKQRTERPTKEPTNHRFQGANCHPEDRNCIEHQKTAKPTKQPTNHRFQGANCHPEDRNCIDYQNKPNPTSLPTYNDLEKGIVILGHQANSIKSVNYFLSHGINGIEADLVFTAEGEPDKFQHPKICDCTCNFYKDSVCAHSNDEGLTCTYSTGYKKWMKHIATKKEVLVIYIDSKVDQEHIKDLKQAGKRVIQALDKYVFGNGYNGQIIVGTPYVNLMDYTRAAVAEAAKSKNKHKYFFSVDGEEKHFGKVMKELVPLTKNRAFATGITACVPKDFTEVIKISAMNQKLGALTDTGIWTLDKEESMMGYMLLGATSFMTNRPAVAVKAVKKAGLKLAKSSPLRAATRDKYVDNQCDCSRDWSAGGCKVTYPAPPGNACKCTSHLFKCEGKVVKCKDPKSPFCKTPTESYGSCKQGGGNCGGYTCECTKSNGGCKIKTAASPGSACVCAVRPWWTFRGGCSAEVKTCDAKKDKCVEPDKSKESCKVSGKGNCNGYGTKKKKRSWRWWG